MYLVLGTVVLLGVWATVGVNVLGPGHDYRKRWRSGSAASSCYGLIRR
jgi:hypothetical protein